MFIDFDLSNDVCIYVCMHVCNNTRDLCLCMHVFAQVSKCRSKYKKVKNYKNNKNNNNSKYIYIYVCVN